MENLVGLSPTEISSGVDIADLALWVSNLARLELDCAEWNMESSTWERLAEEALLCCGTVPGVGLTDHRNNNNYTNLVTTIITNFSLIFPILKFN